MKISDNMTLSKAIVAMFTACVTGPDNLTYGAWAALSQLGRAIFQHTDFDGILLRTQKMTADAAAKVEGMNENESGFDKALNDAEDWLVTLEAVNELAAQFQDAHIELLGKPYEYTPKVSGQARGGDRNERIKALKSGLKASNG
tara:strand:+ start:80 stop:511 length:432 start_codon:yes stop_codon:yes gene_type:complete